MRKLDSNGLMVAKYQATIFERSVDECECSSPYFLKRYLKSEVLFELETRDQELLSFDVNDAMSKIKAEFGNLKYGTKKYSKDVMFWIGYFYAYVCYTRECPLRIVYSLINPQSLADLYYVYHTQSEEWCISRILEDAKETEDIFDKNKRLKKRFETLYKSRIAY